MPPLAPHACALLALAGSAAVALAQGDPLAEPFPPVFQLSDLLPASGGDGSLGLALIGSIESQRAGWVATSAGDLNGDGIDDMLIGSQQGEVPGGLLEQGVAYVVFGRLGGTGPLASFDLGSLDGANGFAMRVDQERFAAGYSAAAAGDVNGDGIDDIVVAGRGSSWSCGHGFLRGHIFVVFGRDSAAGESFPAEFDLLGVDGTTGFAVPGTRDCYTFGSSVAGVGDLNGDGLDDIAFHSHWTQGVYVLFGRSQPAGDAFPARVPLSSIGAGRGFRVSPSSIVTVAAAGDVNGDGFADLALGAPGYDAVRYCYTTYNCAYFGRGRVFVLFGRDGAAQPFADVVNAPALDGSDGFMLSTRKFDARLGSSMAGPGDLNGDGIDDLAVGSPGYARFGLPSDDYGEFHIVYGRAGAFELVIDLDTIGGDDGARFIGTGDACGSRMAAIGDINGDGRRDLAFSCPGRWRSAIDGRVSVVFGQPSTSSIPPEFGLSDIIADLGFTITPARSRGRLGDGLGGAGDFNGDGVDDLFVASPTASPDGRSLAGEAYVVYGRSPCPADLDANGELTLFDFLAFQNLFDAGDPRADFDGDGELTIFDFLAFQNAFDAGC